jgi:hypothetical protein
MWAIHLRTDHVQHRHAYLRRSIPVSGPFEGQSDSLTIQLARKLPLEPKRRQGVSFRSALTLPHLRVPVRCCALRLRPAWNWARRAGKAAGGRDRGCTGPRSNQQSTRSASPCPGPWPASPSGRFVGL